MVEARPVWKFDRARYQGRAGQRPWSSHPKQLVLIFEESLGYNETLSTQHVKGEDEKK